MCALLQSLSRLFLGRSVHAESEDSQESAEKIIAAIRAAKLTYCSPPKLENIAEACDLVARDRVPGDFIEAGVALGGSAILLGRLRPQKARLLLYDVFGLIPAPGENDGEDCHRRFAEISSGKSAGIGGDQYYGYQENLLEVVCTNLRSFGIDPDGDTVELHKGLFQDTLFPDAPIALAHIDCDWFDSVKGCLDRIEPHLSPGAIVVLDDYSSYSGCKRAVDEWLTRNKDLSVIFHRRSLGVRKALA